MYIQNNCTVRLRKCITALSHRDRSLTIENSSAFRHLVLVLNTITELEFGPGADVLELSDTLEYSDVKFLNVI